jgi:hypothetical protein
MSTAVRSALAMLFLLVIGAPAVAQFETAAIVGSVRDASGAVVPGTTVTLTNTATGGAVRRTFRCWADEILTVKDGIYVITGEKTGFR